jgi:MFS family permease
MERDAVMLVAFATLSSFAVSMILPYIPLFGREIGMPLGLVGNLIFAYYAIEALTRIPIGSASDAIGFSLVIGIGAVSFVVAAAFYLASIAVWQWLVIAQLSLGIGMSITYVTIPSYITITDSSVPIYTFSVGFGWLLGPMTGGLLKDELGMMTLFQAFLVVTLLLLVLALVFARIGDDRGRPDAPATDGAPPKSPPARPGEVVSDLPRMTRQSFQDAFALLKTHDRILLAALVSFIMFMNFAMANSLIPLRFEDVGMSSFTIGLLLTIRSGTSTTVRLLTEKVLTFGRKATILIVLTALTGLVLVGFAVSRTFPALVALSIVWGLGGGLYLPVVFSLIADATGDHERGVAMGLRGTLGTAGSAIGVIVFMPIADVTSIESSLALFGAFVVTFAIGLSFYWKGKDPTGSI